VWEAAQLPSHFTQPQASLLCRCKWNQPSWISRTTGRNKTLAGRAGARAARVSAARESNYRCVVAATQGLFFPGGAMVTVAAVQTTSLRPVTSPVIGNSAAGLK